MNLLLTILSLVHVQKGEMMVPQMDSYYAQPITDDDGPDGAPYPDDMDPREIEYMQEMMARQQEMQQQQYQQQSGQMDDISPTKGGKADAVCPWAQVYNQPLVTESRANFQGQQILKPRLGAPHGNGRHLGDENYNMLHDHTGIDGGKSFQKEQQQRTANEQALYMGQQANMDSRLAAQEIRDRMRLRDNVINWGGMQ